MHIRVVPKPFVLEARLMRTLAHPGRLAIIASLRDGRACVCHLTAILRRPQAYLSQQLGILRQTGVIEAQRDGAFIFYRLSDHAILRVLDLAGRIVESPGLATPAVAGRVPGCGCPQCKPAAAPPGGSR